MSRIKLSAALFLIAGTLCWIGLRTGKTAGAADPSHKAFVQSYGDNTEEIAQHRWQHGAATHWRKLVVQR